MLLTLPDDGRPLYRQIAGAVRRALREQQLTAGEKLPTGRDLAAALGVNLDTVQRAYRELADEGLVVSQVGRGTRIVDAPPATRMQLAGDIETLVERARHLGVAVDDLVDIVREVASRT